MPGGAGPDNEIRMSIWPKSIWDFANPARFMRLSGALLPWVSVGAVLALAGGLVWGFFFTPDDYQQGSTVKIIYIHVPAATMAINVYVMMAVTRASSFSSRVFCKCGTALPDARLQ